MNRKRRIRLSLLALLLAIAIALVISGCRREAKKSYIIGFVNSNPGLDAAIEGFKSGLRKYGLFEGRNVTYIYGGAVAENQVDGELKKLKSRKVDLVVTVTTPVTHRAKDVFRGTKTPIVFAAAFLPVESGLVKSLTQPGGNITGVQVGGRTQKALEWHTKAAPTSKNLFVLRPNEEVAKQSFSELEKAAAKLKINIIVKETNTREELKAALDSIPTEADSIWLISSPFIVSNINLFVETALERKLPLSSETSQYKAGVMISFGQNPFRTGEQASRQAHLILEGAAASDIPVETADFFLGINLKNANAIGLKIPDEVLRQADDIVR